MRGGFLDALAGNGPSILAQVQPFQASNDNPGVTISPVAVLLALAGLAAIILTTVSALRVPRSRMRLRGAEPRKSRDKPKLSAPPLPEPAPVAQVYKKAPIAIQFPMIKAPFADVWGTREKATILFKVEDRGLMGQREIQGLTATIGNAPLPLVFFKGEARVERTFETPGDASVVVDLKVRGERMARRSARPLRIVDYREEIADLFAQFKDEASATITPLRHDATAWEIYDALLDASPQLSQVALREVVSSFEEAKFSNHAVGRGTYEKMVNALRVLRRKEA